jgi:ParB family chromosome partitioning protein
MLELDIYKKIVAQDLSVRAVEQLVREAANAKRPAPEKKTNESGREIVQLQTKLASHFGTKVQVNSDGKKGEIKIPFVSVEDLNRILEILDM